MNAPGPFYVVKDQCITCMAPEAEAPSLMAFDDEHSSCYFRRQPETADETYRAVRAVWASCCGAVRYGGSNPGVLRRLAVIGLAEQADVPLTPVPRRAVRDRATFGYAPEADAGAIAAAVGRKMLAAYSTGAVSEAAAASGSASFLWQWAPQVRSARMGIVVEESGDAGRRWMIRLTDVAHPAVPAVATAVDDALRATGSSNDVRWYTREDWRGTRTCWSPYPV